MLNVGPEEGGNLRIKNEKTFCSLLIILQCYLSYFMKILINMKLDKLSEQRDNVSIGKIQ
jgi:hypothetical protein